MFTNCLLCECDRLLETTDEQVRYSTSVLANFFFFFAMVRGMYILVLLGASIVSVHSNVLMTPSFGLFMFQ